MKLGIEEVGEAIVAHSGLTIAALLIAVRTASLVSWDYLPGLELDAVNRPSCPEQVQKATVSKSISDAAKLDAHQLVDLVGNYQSRGPDRRSELCCRERG